MNISYPSSVQQSASVLAYFSAYIMMPLRDTILTMVLCALRTWHSSQNNIFSYCFGLFEESRRQCDGPCEVPFAHASEPNPGSQPTVSGTVHG